jgi:hypothetical protein
VGTGETLGSALQNYKSVLRNTGGSSSIDTGGEQKELSGTIDRISSEINDGNTVYYMILREKPTKIYVAVSDISPELALTKEGDSVTLTYLESERSVIDLSAFDNTMFTQS